MVNLKTCQVKLFNKVYQVKCPESEEANLVLAAAKLNERINGNKKKFKQLDNFQMLLLAALDVSHELVLCQNEHEQHKAQVNQFISSLEGKINKTMSGEA
jgi:cell division protein ZapA